MDCNQARRLLDFARPGVTELDALDTSSLEQHLADCAACGRASRADRRADDRIAAAMQAVVPLPGAMERLLDRAGRERSGWYRRAAMRASLATAACLAGWWAYPAPALDADSIAAVALEQFGNRAAAQEWLTRQDTRFEFPPKFQSRYLVGFERREFHGVAAPVLTFVRRNSLARVVVLTSKQFRNLPSLPAGQVAENSVSTLIVLRDADLPGVVYLVEVLNGPVEPFFTEDEPGVT